MILGIITIFLSLLVVIFGYTTFNLLGKNEKAEDIILSQQELLTKLMNKLHSRKRD